MSDTAASRPDARDYQELHQICKAEKESLKTDLARERQARNSTEERANDRIRHLKYELWLEQQHSKNLEIQERELEDAVRRFGEALGKSEKELLLAYETRMEKVKEVGKLKIEKLKKQHKEERDKLEQDVKKLRSENKKLKEEVLKMTAIREKFTREVGELKYENNLLNALAWDFKAKTDI